MLTVAHVSGVATDYSYAISYPTHFAGQTARSEWGASLSTDETQLQHSITRRLNNFSLSPSPDNSLIGVYEAISNSIHAASDTGSPEKIAVYVTVVRDVLGDPDGFVIVDNGVGLNSANFHSFRHVDSDFKIKRGGKGVGRLMWLKTFDSVAVSSIFTEGGKWYLRRFNFILNDIQPFVNYSLQEISSGKAETVIELRGLKPEYKAVAPKKGDTIVKSIARHFVRDLISPTAPKIVINDNGSTVLNDFFKENIVRSEDDNFDIEIQGKPVKFHLKHFLASKDLKDQDTNENTLYFLAHGRVVERRVIGGLIGLKRLASGETYLGLIESDFFNAGVSVERTMFTLNADLIDRVTRAAAERITEFLTTETLPIREKQLQIVQYIRKEFPRYIATIGDPAVFAGKLPLGAKDQETIFRTVSLEWYRNKRRVDREIRVKFTEAAGDDAGGVKIKEAVAKLVSAVDAETKAALADYLAERKVIIDVFGDLLKKLRTGKYELESQVHDMVCPRGKSSDGIDFQAHNLWLLDERLPFYTFFNSDKTIGQQTSDGEGGKKPDITFFDIAISFQQKKEPVPIIIVEFKRPGRDNYTAAENPIDQCLDYVRKIKSGGAAIDSKGQHVSWINKDTLFYCYVVADVTPSFLSIIETHDLIQTPDGRGYWKFHDRLQTIIEVVPFDKIIDGVKGRHEAFFAKLGIN